MATVPNKLIVCIFKVKSYYSKNVDRLMKEYKPLPPKLKAIRDKRVEFTRDVMGKKVLWMGGPAIGLPLSINVFAVDSIEEARKIQQKDPCFACGLFYDDKYFEWDLHVAFADVSPGLKARFKKMRESENPRKAPKGHRYHGK
jgi:hypothetical protein